ncbi:hypothetical protein CR513_22358, partial [Mucuna pruriens]
MVYILGMAMDECLAIVIRESQVDIELQDRVSSTLLRLSALSRDRVRYVSIESISGQSLPRATRHLAKRKDPHKHLNEFHVNFYEGLTMMDRSMIDAASGGALMDKMLVAARHLISNMASNTQQFGIRGASQPRMVNEIDAVDNLRLENQLTELTSLVRKLAVGQHQPSIVARVCGICTFVEHPIDMCPTLQEIELDYPESVGVISGYQYRKQPYQGR